VFVVAEMSFDIASNGPLATLTAATASATLETWAVASRT
jgi:hypothetical protein